MKLYIVKVLLKIARLLESKIIGLIIAENLKVKVETGKDALL